jgi:alanine dehydrogenase
MILLSGRDLRALLEPLAVVDALRQAYAALAKDRGDSGKSVAFAIDGGSAHIKAGLLPGSRAALAAKINVNLPENARLRGLPTIQGALLLSDTVSGAPLVLMDSIVLTGIRTAATAMLAASFGARQDSKIAAVIGCGAQARYQVGALIASYPIEEIRLYDIEERRARDFASELANAGRRIIIAPAIAMAVDGADIVTSCTTSKRPILLAGMPLSRCFVAAVGADNPQKCEIDPALMGHARIIADDIEQCASGGDLAHAIKADAIARHQVHADLADLASGAKRGRENATELVIFDSSGSGVQDVAAAWLAYRLAAERGTGTSFDIAG